MAAHGLWGVLAPNSGTAARDPQFIDRPTAIGPAKGILGLMGPQHSGVSRPLTPAHVGTCSELIGIRESAGYALSVNLGTFSFLVGLGEAAAGTRFVSHTHGELIGFRELAAARKAGAGACGELVAIVDSSRGLATVVGSHSGVAGELMEILDASSYVKGGKTQASERLSVLESAQGFAGPPTSTDKSRTHRWGRIKRRGKWQVEVH